MLRGVRHRAAQRALELVWAQRGRDGRGGQLWQDRSEGNGRIYRSWQTDRLGAWKSRPGFVELIETWRPRATMPAAKAA